MCAINGFNWKDEDFVLKMNKATRHRGPDGTGTFFDNGISFGHNRLSIIDLSEAANQPMESHDKNLAVTFNGEIYNFQELKKDLSDYPFRTKSDTEVILAAYKKWGNECVKKLNGIFAFAIWDKTKKELFLARDHVGVKPLYYYQKGNKFIFSSEIKAILEHDIPRKLNLEAFSHYLRVLYVPEPLTMFDGIKKLPPASFAILRNNNLKIENYWQARIGEKRSVTEEELRNKVKESVKKQLISDKPLGVYLSGGVDSSVVLDSMAKNHKKIDTFSVGFELQENEEREKFNADFHVAKQTANFYGTKHCEVLVRPNEVINSLEKVIWHVDEPISNPTSIPMIILAAFAKQKVDVVLGGDGGDELFGGYERYRLSKIASLYQKTPDFFRKVLSANRKFKKLNTPSGIKRFALFHFQKDDILREVISDNFLDLRTTEEFFDKKYFENSSREDFEELFMETDRKSWLVDQELMLADKMSMSAGLEHRVPLLDKELVEFSNAIYLKDKVGIFDKKIVFKKAFRGELPEFLFNQPKRGWFSPGAKWLRYPEINRFAKQVLSEKFYSGTSKIFKWNDIRNILDVHTTGKRYNLVIIWALLTFQLWAKRYRIEL